MMSRVSLISGQDSGTVSKSPGVRSPAIALPHQAVYPNPDVNSSTRFMQYDAVIPGPQYKQVSSASVSCMGLF